MKQLRLLDEPLPTPIPGLVYLPDFITTQQEAELISYIDAQPWLADLKRRVQHYGWKYDYKARAVDETMRLGALPDWLAVLVERLKEEGLFKDKPDQVIINEYLPGQGISPHVDCAPCFGYTIASLSLSSQCIMEFSHNERSEKQQIVLQPCSLLVLSGEARYQWKHAVPARKSDKVDGLMMQRDRRLSLTFRNIITSDT